MSSPAEINTGIETGPATQAAANDSASDGAEYAAIANQANDKLELHNSQLKAELHHKDALLEAHAKRAQVSADIIQRLREKLHAAVTNAVSSLGQH